MSAHTKCIVIRFAMICAWAVLAALNVRADKPAHGLSVTYSSGKHRFTSTAENVRLYVRNGESPSPFLPAGKFTAVWEGFISANLRGDYSFQAQLNGDFKLEINGTNLLETTMTSGISEMSKTIRLAKGTNLFKATFTASSPGDPYVRLNWIPKNSFAQPIPPSALSHFVDTHEDYGKKLLLGRELFVEHRCAKCHSVAETGMPELTMDAPSFEEIGSRRNSDWMARWIENPKQMRSSARMPANFHGDSAKADSEAVAAFLSSLKSSDQSANKPESTAAQIEAGKKLFATLHCTACHDAPESTKVSTNKIHLKHVREKFPDGALAEFLKQPEKHYAWTRMPRFKRTDEQRHQLAAYLSSKGEASKPGNFSPEMMMRGKQLVQTTGCLNCHSLDIENQFSAKPLAQISNWKSGCLAEKPSKDAPQFAFSPEEREALVAFVATDRSSLTRHVPAEFAERQTRNLNCIECHNKIEGVPRFELLGGKLKPEWSAQFIAGEMSYKPRPWVAAQMPAFPAYAKFLAEGMAMQHGVSPVTRAEPPPDSEMVEVGRKLVSAPPVGFSCVSCHAVGEANTSQAFESPGINLAHSGERLLPDFFKRWLRSPTAIDPVTKMPTYFDDEGNSPLIEVFEGDGAKQIEAMRQYMRLGKKMPAPTME